MQIRYLKVLSLGLLLGSLAFSHWGCLAVNHPPEIPANEVSPDISYLWPEEKSLIKKTPTQPQKLDTNKIIGTNNGVIAVVNDQLITLKEFDAQFHRALQSKSVFKKESVLFDEILSAMVDQLLLLELAYQKEIEILPEEIDKKLEKISKSHPQGWDGLKKDLEGRKNSIENFKEEIEKSLMLEKIEGQVVGYIRNPPPREIQKVYKDRIKEFQSVEKRDISFITIFKSDYKNDQSAIERISQKTQERLKKEDFNQVLISMSEDGKGEEGIKGFVERKDLADSISEIAFKLKQGEWSGPHSLPGLIIFVKCHAIMPKQTKSLNEVQEMIIQSIINETRYQKIEKALEGIKSRSYIRKMPHQEYFEYRRNLSQ